MRVTSNSSAQVDQKVHENEDQVQTRRVDVDGEERDLHDHEREDKLESSTNDAIGPQDHQSDQKRAAIVSGPPVSNLRRSERIVDKTVRLSMLGTVLNRSFEERSQQVEKKSGRKNTNAGDHYTRQPGKDRSQGDNVSVMSEDTSARRKQSHPRHVSTSPSYQRDRSSSRKVLKAEVVPTSTWAAVRRRQQSWFFNASNTTYVVDAKSGVRRLAPKTRPNSEMPSLGCINCGHAAPPPCFAELDIKQFWIRESAPEQSYSGAGRLWRLTWTDSSGRAEISFAFTTDVKSLQRAHPRP